ncbi:MAG: hypothetical protein WAV73_00755 [Candidatus Moraniibacteriota bacterium]
MKKQTIWLGALFLVLALAGCGNKAPEVTDQKKPVEKTVPIAEKKDDGGSSIFSGSLKDLMAKGTSMQCSWSADNESGKVSGTVYVNGDKFYQEFLSSQPEKGEMKSFILNDGEWLYQWSTFSKMGTKMKMDEAKKLAEDFQENPAMKAPGGQDVAVKSEDLDSKFDYNCKKWNVDASKFVLPTDIQFNDLSQMLNALPKEAGGKPEIDVCQMCESLPAEAKASCLSNCQK